MSRALLFLNGLAIILVPVHHATAYGLQAMFLWTDRYRDVAVPNYDQLHSFAYYATIIVRQLDAFVVPAFLFISGYFVVALARGKEARLTWAVVLPRIKMLIPPFIIWTAVRYLLLRSLPTNLHAILDPLYFIPLLIQFYLLAPLLMPLARKHWRPLLLVLALLQLGIQGLRYLNFLDIPFPGLSLLLPLTPRYMVLGQQLFWFPLGIVFGLHAATGRAWLAARRWQMLALTLFFALCTVLEYELADRLTTKVWIGATFAPFMRNFYIVCFLLTVVSWPIRPGKFTRLVTTIGAHSLGIYVVNIPVIYEVAKLIYHHAPHLLDQQILYQFILAAVGLGGPLLLMWLVRQTPLRPHYRTLFG